MKFVKSDNKLYIIIIFIFLSSVFASCFTAAYTTTVSNRELQSKKTEVIRGYNPNWAELRVSDTVYVKKINGETVNWTPGFISFVPSDKLVIEVGHYSSLSFTETVTMTCDFKPGNSYMIECKSVTTEERGNLRITTFSGNINIDLPPNRYISFSVDTYEAKIFERKNIPVGFIGK